MKRFAIVISLLLFLLQGCTSEEDNFADSSLSMFRKLVEQAADENKEANEKLFFLLDPNYKKTEYDKITADTVSFETRLFYYVIVENPNPVLNRFALYNSELQPLLIDETLNGDLSIQKKNLSGRNSFLIYEDFFSADSIRLQRMSIYSLYDTVFSLSFRSFTMMKDGEKIYYNRIVNTDTREIIASMIGPDKKKETDIFIFDEEEKKYISKTDLFNSFVEQRIKNSGGAFSGPVIYNNASALWSLGINIDEESKLIRRGEFSIILGKNWGQLPQPDSGEIKTAGLKGYFYGNASIGSEIFIGKIPLERKSEEFVQASFNHSSKGKYTVRFSDKKLIGENFVQYFEYTCGGECYILVIKTPAKTYEIFKPIYQTIINSFNMEC